MGDALLPRHRPWPSCYGERVGGVWSLQRRWWGWGEPLQGGWLQLFPLPLFLGFYLYLISAAAGSYWCSVLQGDTLGLAALGLGRHIGAPRRWWWQPHWAEISQAGLGVPGPCGSQNQDWGFPRSGSQSQHQLSDREVGETTSCPLDGRGAFCRFILAILLFRSKMLLQKERKRKIRIITCSVASVVTLCVPVDAGATFTRRLCPWDSPGKNAGVGCHALLKGTLPTRRSSPCLLCFLHWQVDSLPMVPLGKPNLI